MVHEETHATVYWPIMWNLLFPMFDPTYHWLLSESANQLLIYRVYIQWNVNFTTVAMNY